jgi:hypothetical protein
MKKWGSETRRNYNGCLFKSRLQYPWKTLEIFTRKPLTRVNATVSLYSIKCKYEHMHSNTNACKRRNGQTVVVFRRTEPKINNGSHELDSSIQISLLIFHKMSKKTSQHWHISNNDALLTLCINTKNHMDMLAVWNYRLSPRPGLSQQTGSDSKQRQRPDRLWSPPSFLSNGYWDKVAEAHNWPPTSVDDGVTVGWLTDWLWWGETMSHNCAHQRAYCSSPGWYVNMENHGGDDVGCG